MRNRVRVSAVVGILLTVLAGCGGGGERDLPSSGDPEADRRAEMRVGADTGGEDAKTKKTLFDRLGGSAGIAALVHDFTARTISDPRVNFQRIDVRSRWTRRQYPAWIPTKENIEKLNTHMVEFITLAAGGPTEYTGRKMGVVHKGMRISNSEFDAMVGDIKTSMEKLGYAKREIRELLAVIETTRKEIVEQQ
jgi:hemoglobin